MIDDILINKAQIIRRCLARVREEYRGDPARLRDFTIQDSIVLNLQRACEAAIDLAMHAVASRALGVPQTSRDAFALLHDARLISAETTRRMQAMVGFRNIAIHSYEELRLAIVQSVIEMRLGDFEMFVAELSARPEAKL